MQLRSVDKLGGLTSPLLWVFGYIQGDFEIKLNKPTTLIFENKMNFVLNHRRVVAFYPRIRIESIDFPKRPGLVAFIPDPGPVNQITCVIHRFGCEMPEKKDPLPFVAYAKAFIRKNFKPIRDDDITTSFEWLSDASYSGSRKRQLMELMSTVRNHDSKFVQNKSFIKFEGYMEPKNARGINSYHDALKLLLGPVCKAIDKSTFSTKWFVKGTDPRDWPKLLSKLFGSSRVRETDFSSFEAHHADEFAEVVAYWIKHMLRGVTIPRVYKRMILRCMLGVNVCKFHNITVRLKQRLMSGALS